jgi:exo-1,4-beta-D-glucosaminidase
MKGINHFPNSQNMPKELILKIGILFAMLWPGVTCAQKSSDPHRFLLKTNWFVQNSDLVKETGSVMSKVQVSKAKWYKATVPNTVMGVLTANGKYKDIFVGDNYKNIDKKQFDTPWWYYREFKLSIPIKGQHVTLNLDGISYYANIWLNGKLLASRDSTYGAFRRFSFDITKLVNGKTNQLAIEVFRAQPGDFNLGFVDWNPRPADENMGIWREVYLEVSGAVGMQNTYVEPELNPSDISKASLTVNTSLKNNLDKAVNGLLKGKIDDLEFRYPVKLAAGQLLDLKLTPEQIPALRIKSPRIWWCNKLGSPELYNLELSFETSGVITDSQKTTFGIRKIEMYTNSKGHKGFKLNGKEVLIKGAGWTDDLFLRDSLKSIETQIKYVKHMNLNTIRLEGFWGNSQAIYDLCDKYGILVMVGWSCHWEWDEYLGKECGDYGGLQTENDMNLAINSMRDQVLWLRNHPSIFVWMVGSDKCPKPELETRYINLFKSLDNRPYLASAGTRVSTISGPTGVKMNGPYEYVAPSYWYTDTIYGGAFGFNTETGPGPQLPILESMKKMIPASKLWPPNEIWDYHCTHSKQAFNKMDVFNTALEARYGKANNLNDYLLKSDAQSYEALRAMFEAFRVNIPQTTGIIQWMLNSAWPSTYWQLYDYYLRPTTAYYAARTANQPVQLIYNYHNHAVYAVNEKLEEIKNYTATVILMDINSKTLINKTIEFSLPTNTSKKLIQFDAGNDTEFLSLKVTDVDGNRVSGNFYWLSDKPDEFAWDKTTWAFTPLKSYTDFSQLNTLPESRITVVHKTEKNGSDMILRASLFNLTNKLAFFVSLSLQDEKGGSIIPALWNDNYISLLPGEKREITCTIPLSSLKGIKPQFEITGWNVKRQIIPTK